MAEVNELAFETDDVVAAKNAKDKIFESSTAVVSFVSERFKRAEEIIEVYMVLMSNLLKQKSLVYLLKSPRLKRWLLMGRSLMFYLVITNSLYLWTLLFYLMVLVSQYTLI